MRKNMGDKISVTSEDIQSVAKALSVASNEYKTNYDKLSSLIQEITNGGIKGPVADDLRAKFEAKEETFRSLKNVIDDAEEFMNQEKSKFNSMMNDLTAGMR